MTRTRINPKTLTSTKLTVLSGLFVCFGIILPFITSHAYGFKGNVILPMHMPVLLCGFFCGAKRGFITGIATPLLSSIMTNMPVPYPMLPIMMLELSTYGLVSGLLFSKGLKVVPTLTISMLLGRLGYAIMFYFLTFGDPTLKLGPNPLISTMPVISALIIGIPGIIIQLTLIPLILTKLTPKKSNEKRLQNPPQ